MGMSANVHGATRAKACGDSELSWLQIENADGDHINVFMPLDRAHRMAAAFNAQPEPYPQDYDDGNITP